MRYHTDTAELFRQGGDQQTADNSTDLREGNDGTDNSIGNIQAVFDVNTEIGDDQTGTHTDEGLLEQIGPAVVIHGIPVVAELGQLAAGHHIVVAEVDAGDDQRCQQHEAEADIKGHTAAEELAAHGCKEVGQITEDIAAGEHGQITQNKGKGEDGDRCARIVRTDPPKTGRCLSLPENGKTDNHGIRQLDIETLVDVSCLI